MLRIIHISDLHIAANNGTHNWRKAGKILDEALAPGFDHLLLTGDMVQEPTPENFALARKILGDYGLLKSGRLSITIGNHEVYGGVHLAKEIFDFPRKCRETDYVGQIRQFRDHFPEAFEDVLTASPGDIFPHAKMVDDYAILSINTIAPYSLWRNIAASRGHVAAEELTKLKVLLRLPQVVGKNKIAITHHHFSRHRVYGANHENPLWRKFESLTIGLRTAGKLIDILDAGGVMMVFHGHLHESTIYERGGIRFVNAGGSADSPGSPYICYNTASIGRESAEIHVHRIPFARPAEHERPAGVELIPEFAE